MGEFVSEYSSRSEPFERGPWTESYGWFMFRMRLASAAAVAAAASSTVPV